MVEIKLAPVQTGDYKRSRNVLYRLGFHAVRPPSCLQDGVVLPRVLGVVSLQQTTAHRGAGTGELGHVEVCEAQLRRGGEVWTRLNLDSLMEAFAAIYFRHTLRKRENPVTPSV